MVAGSCAVACGTTAPSAWPSATPWEARFRGTLTYDWQEDSPGGHFIKNPSAWWTFDKVTGTLTIGIDAGATNLDIPELAEELPWRLYQYQKFHDNMRAVVFRNDAAPLNPAFWFKNYNFIERFEGGSMDPSKATSFSEMFAGCTALRDLVGISNWNLASATNLSKMFYDCDSLATLTGIARWNVSNVANFSNMFAQALNDKGQVVGTGLVDASAIKAWNFASAVTLENMFLNCKNLTTVDFSGWDVVTGAPKLTNMLANATSLSKMTLGPRSVLVGAGLDNITTRTDSDGRWYLPNYTWFGDCTDMKDRYGTSGNSLGASLVYTWDGTTLGGRFKNQNTWWIYDKASKLLTIGSDNGGDKTITETAEELPWMVIPGLTNILSFNTNGATIIANPPTGLPTTRLSRASMAPTQNVTARPTCPACSRTTARSPPSRALTSGIPRQPPPWPTCSPAARASRTRRAHLLGYDIRHRLLPVSSVATRRLPPST